VRATPLTNNSNPIARSAPAPKQLQGAQERRRALIISGILFVVGLAFVLMMTAEYPMSAHSMKSSQAVSEGPDNNLSSGKVMIDSADGNGCRQHVFDNQTWRMTRSQQPCDTTARDSNGVPIPLGTIHRLDAINKSFLGR
jgi:hypothetical protein